MSSSLRDRIVRDGSCINCPFRHYDTGFVSRHAGYDCLHPLNGDHPTRIIDGPPSVAMPGLPAFCPWDIDHPTRQSAQPSSPIVVERITLIGLLAFLGALLVLTADAFVMDVPPLLVNMWVIFGASLWVGLFSSWLAWMIAPLWRRRR